MNLIADVLTVLGGGAGVALLAAMAALPLYADAASRHAPVPAVPAPRAPVDTVALHRSPVA